MINEFIFFKHENNSDIVFVFFLRSPTQLCVCMMSPSDNRVITVSPLIPSHSWMPWILLTQRLLIKKGNDQETSKQLMQKILQQLLTF